MSKLTINREAKYYKHLTRLSGFILFIFAYAVVITGSTYAFKIITATSNVATGEGGCFQVNYSGQNLNAGDLLTTTNYLDGAHTTVTLSKDSTCKIYNEANIYLHTNDTTTAPIDSKPALRYKLLSGENEISEGIISSKGDYILATVPITDTATTYTVYLWIDSDLSEGAYHGTSFSGYIYAESAQTSTIENQYLVSFNANGGGKIAPKTVTYGSTYGTLPTPTRNGYTFAGWSLVPSEYQQVEYISSSGTQYIDTNIKPTNELGVSATLSSSNITADKLYFGSKGTDNSRFWIGNVNSQAYFGWNSVLGPRQSISENTIFSIKMNYLNDRKTFFNNSNINSNIATLATNTYPIYIFAGNVAGTANYKSNISLYNLSLTSNKKIIKNFIPCYKKTDIEHPGLCDTVTGKFYSNSGTGNFTKGNNSSYITSSSTVTQEHNHTLYAVWTPKTYTVTFNANGGNVSTTTKQVTMGQPYGTLPTPTRSGYTFKGWNGKNLFNYQIATGFNVTLNNGNVNQIEADSRTDLQWKIQAYNSNTYVKLLKNTYVKNTTGTTDASFVKDSTFDRIRFGLNGAQKDTLVYYNTNSLPNGKTYTLSFNITNTTQGSVSWNNIQLEEGSSATTYEPYYVATSTTVTQAKNHTLTAIWEQN